MADAILELGLTGGEKTVALNMADGDQVIEDENGAVLSKVTVQKPVTLVPENIIQGVDVGGVVGTAVFPQLNAPTVATTDYAEYTSISTTNPATNGNFASEIKYYINGELVTTAEAPSSGSSKTVSDVSLYNGTDGEQTIGVSLSADNFSDSEMKTISTTMYGINLTPEYLDDGYDKPAIKGGATYSANMDRKTTNEGEYHYFPVDISVKMNGSDCEYMLRDAGYQVKGGKVPSLFGGDQKRFLRMDTLGKGYTPEDFRAVIAGEKEHTPKKYRAAKAAPEKKSGSLLIDIQKAIQEGKSGKYLDFINSYNLKQIAQSVAYLEERDMLDRELLAKNAAAASDRFHELSGKIKGAETRMKEIAVLREHIRNYIKTRDTYVAYRKAGYSKKFLAKHESEITLHKAAKKKFDELGVKKLPTLKSLDAEYARLLAEKKALFPEYRKAREEMKELLTAKSNFDRLLGMDEEREEPNATKEKGTEQR